MCADNCRSRPRPPKTTITLPLDGSYSYSANGSGVNVYIIDTGIRRTHSEFGGRVVPAFTSIYDGSLDAHLDELTSITSDMNAIWGACEGYTGASDFPSFVSACAQEPAAYYIAFRDETVESITRAIDARRRGQSLQDNGGPRVRVASNGRRDSLLRRALRAAPIVVDLVRTVVRSGFGHVFHGTSQILASLDRYPLFRVFNWITRNQIPPLK